MMLATIPGRAAGKTTFLIASLFVDPRPKAASRKECGTALITSSDRDETKGIIIIPITKPAASADSDATSRPRSPPVSRKKGAIVRAAKNPYTTVGTPARISNKGLTVPRTRLVAYSDRKIAAIRPTGTETLSAIMEIRNVPANSGIAP